MALICNDCEVRGKRKQIWCKHTDSPCAFLRFCTVSMKYYQTDGAKRCKVRNKENEKKKLQADKVNTI